MPQDRAEGNQAGQREDYPPTVDEDQAIDEDQAMRDIRVPVQDHRLLVVSRDAAFVDELRVRLSDVDVVSLTESTTRHALLSGSPLLDDVGLVVLDGTVSGRVRLRLYDRLRPVGRATAVSVVFTRSRFRPARSEGARGVDLYLLSDATVRETAWWCGALLRLPRRSVSRRPGPGLNRLPVPASSRVAPSVARASGYAWIGRAGLWGVAAALAALTLWPPAERSALGEAFRAQVRARFGVPAVFADTPALPGPAARPAVR